MKSIKSKKNQKTFTVFQTESISDALDWLEDDLLEEAIEKIEPMDSGTNYLEKSVSLNRNRWKTWGILAASLTFVVLAASEFSGVFKTLEVPRSEQSIPSEESKRNETQQDENQVSSKTPKDFENLGKEQKENETTKNNAAYGFSMENELVYFPISFEERIRFGLLRKGADDLETTDPLEKNQEEKPIKEEIEEGVDPDGMGLTPENTYQITEADLGEVMGIVKKSADSDMIGCVVYHVAFFPDLDAICILDYHGTYEFYVSDGYVTEAENQSFDRVLAAYQMPETVIKMEVEDQYGQSVLEITNQEDFAEICTLLSGKTTIGMQANNERYAKLWKDTYGNEEVFYDGETFHYSDQVDYDAVHDFWHKNQRIVWITTQKGFRFCLLYNPAIKTLECQNGFYDLSEKEVATLNLFFGVE